MENNEQFDDLIIGYLSNQLNEAQEDAVIAWINADEQNRQYFEAINRAWRLSAINTTMATVDVDAEWNSFRQTIGNGQASVVNTNNEDSTDDGVIELAPDNRRVVFSILRRVAIAASIVAIVVFGWNRFSNKSSEKELVSNPKTSEPTYAVHREINSTGSDKKLLLEDGSEVLLADKSELVYTVPFISNKRDVTLVGKATFNVAKDSTKPFTVISGDITTTALGTRFTVTNFEGDNRITVRLFEGKVVIKSTKSALVKMNKDYFLMPGHEFIYDKTQSGALVRKFDLNNKVGQDLATTTNDNDDPSLPKNDIGDWYMFNNQRLDDVLDQLSALYSTKIIYDKKDIRKIYFTAKYNRLESLGTILDRIAAINQLTIIKNDTAFIVSK